MAALGNKYTLFGQPESQKWSKLAELSKQQGTYRILIPYTEFWEGAAGQAGALIYRVSFRLKPECTRHEKLQALLTLTPTSVMRERNRSGVSGRSSWEAEPQTMSHILLVSFFGIILFLGQNSAQILLRPPKKVKVTKRM